jgi:hypothetical protein
MCQSLSFRALLGLVSILCLPCATQAQNVYQTGFESDEAIGFNVGPLPQGGWTQITGPGVSSVTDAVSFQGEQSLRVAPESSVDRMFETGATTVYLDGWFLPSLSSTYLDLAETGPASALFLFHTTQGLVALDGDGNGGGVWIPAGFTALGDFVRLTVRLNFAVQNWDLFVNENQVLAGYGFKDDSITSFSGLTISAATDASSFLDTFVVTTVPPGFAIPTQTPSPTATGTRTSTPTASNTAVPTSTQTPVPTATRSTTPTVSPTPSLVPTPSPTLNPNPPDFLFQFAFYWGSPTGTPGSGPFDPNLAEGINARDLLSFFETWKNAP